MKIKILLIILIISVSQLSSYYFGQNKIQPSIIDWSKIETLHFDIYFEKGLDDFGKIAALMSEEAYYYLKKDFKTPVKSRIPIIFYKSHQEFGTTNIIFPLLNEGVGGFTESAKNRVVVPFDGSFRKLEEVLIHELTHAYINELNRTKIGLFEFSVFPFWFQEGLPEFEAVGGESNYNNMFIIDMVMNDGVYDLNQVGSYYAYREGESFLSFICDEYGHDVVMDYFYATRISSNLDAATKDVFGIDFNEIQLLWKNHIKRKYFSLISDFQVPYEIYDRKTDHNKDGSYLNFAPRFSPDGQNYLYFSNKNLRNDIWRGVKHDVISNKRIIKGEISGKFEEFHFQRNNFGWFPGGDYFAFVAKTSFGDKIYKIDFDTEKVVDSYAFPGFDAVYEIDVSHDGEKIVFSGQKELKNDIYIFTIQTGEITQITNDSYLDYQPKWSPDDSKIAFTSERTLNNNTKRNHVFNKLTNNIFYYSLTEKKFYIVTKDEFINDSPIWDKTGTKIIFISERNNIKNFEITNITNGKRAFVTNSLGGMISGDIDPDNENMLFSCFYNGGWDIYQLENPLKNLEYEFYFLPERYEFSEDFYDRFEIDRYKVFGKQKRKFKKEIRKTSRKNATTFDFVNGVELDSLNKNYNIRLDKKPNTENIPEIAPYKIKFSLDGLWGGMAYSTSGGAYGQLSFSLSDLMRNHMIGVDVGISQQLKDSDFVLNYLYLGRRIDYGFGGFYINNETIYQIPYENQPSSYYYKRIRDLEFGAYSILRYPFNRFWRIDMENVLYQHTKRYDILEEHNENWVENHFPKDENIVYAPQLSLVHDNSIYGSVGPVSGWRWMMLFNRNFSKNENYSVFYSDLRRYLFFAKRYSFAFRVFGGSIFWGETLQRFDLGYYNGVRGYDTDDIGLKKVVSSAEIRFPFIENFRIVFPLPIWLYNIRGSAFVDAGAIWTENKKFIPVKEGMLNDLKLGFGVGPRINLGYFVLKFDVAWSTDLVDVSKPVFYISLLEDF